MDAPKIGQLPGKRNFRLLVKLDACNWDDPLLDRQPQTAKHTHIAPGGATCYEPGSVLGPRTSNSTRFLFVTAVFSMACTQRSTAPSRAAHDGGAASQGVVASADAGHDPCEALEPTQRTLVVARVGDA